MIIYNVTIKIDNDIHDDWFEWMKDTHIADVMQTGFFIGYQIAKVLVDDTDGITYSIQYKCNQMDDLNGYYSRDASRLQAEHMKRYKDKFVAFRTLLEVLN